MSEMNKKKFHINKRGVVSVCRATKLVCPMKFDGEYLPTFNFKSEATEYLEKNTKLANHFKKMNKSHKPLPEWKIHEASASEYVGGILSSIAEVIHLGGSNRHDPDIKITKKAGGVVLVDAKLNKAQSGQFVLLVENGFYTLKPSSEVEAGGLTQEIIDVINENKILDIGSQVEIPIPEEKAVAWVVEYHKSKGVSFIVAEDNKIIPVEDFGEHFKVAAFLRNKKSGSDDLPKSDIPIVENLSQRSLVRNGKKVFVTTKDDLSKELIETDDATYSFKLVETDPKNKYEVRKLSKIVVPTVTFAINMKKDAPSGLSEAEFIKQVKAI